MSREYTFNDVDRPTWCHGDPNTTTGTNHFPTEGFQPVVSRDNVGRLRIDGERVGEGFGRLLSRATRADWRP